MSGLLLGQLASGFPPAVAVRVCTPEGSPYAAAGGWARLADADLPEPVPAGFQPVRAGFPEPVPASFPEPVPADAETLFDWPR